VALNYRPYIVSNPAVCGGEPVVTGTRVTVRSVLASLAEGLDPQQIIEHFPTLSIDDIRAVLAFAALSTEEYLPVPSAPALP
jgi:uncharacterized protein (DUF433 family)